MNKKMLNMLPVIAAAGFGIAGLVLVLLSIFSDRHTLIPGLLCVALGTICNLIRTLRQKKSFSPGHSQRVTWNRGDHRNCPG